MVIGKMVIGAILIGAGYLVKAVLDGYGMWGEMLISLGLTLLGLGAAHKKDKELAEMKKQTAAMTDLRDEVTNRNEVTSRKGGK